MHKNYRLTEKQRAFARHVASGLSATAAARQAGYSITYANRQASQLLDNHRVAEYLKELTREAAGAAIADAAERQSWWSQLMRDGNAEVRDRLKASELLGRCQGDFIDRRSTVTESSEPQVWIIGDRRLVF